MRIRKAAAIAALGGTLGLGGLALAIASGDAAPAGQHDNGHPLAGHDWMGGAPTGNNDGGYSPAGHMWDDSAPTGASGVTFVPAGHDWVG
ncbi:hypothetical protein [Actinomadura fibrosa]|uniref:Uncharacterized protein n=1 Tax=Actinomadura fibrosa TaxID=111802 RepID=A0ABW2XYJ6_9ACTN|nr:hypothetical protein [Actinomadura fibrosa]